jgi:hypothetical protein
VAWFNADAARSRTAIVGGIEYLEGRLTMFRQILIAACFAAPLAIPLASLAADKEQTPQQQKMGACNKEAGAKNLSGDERNKFMSNCLSADAKPAAGAMTPQQEKMGMCNKEAAAKNLAGDARKKFMSECLAADGKPAAAPMTQQEKMGYCNKQAAAKKVEGDARKKFMSDCLSG